MWTYFAIAVGGTLGCWARFAQTQLVQAVYGRDFPYATMSINVIGSFVMGFLFVETLERLILPPALRTGILTGVLGGYTTFSTYAAAVMTLLTGGSPAVAVAYALGSIAGAMAAVWCGVRAARAASRLPARIRDWREQGEGGGQ